jgi:hypothetical protein
MKWSLVSLTLLGVAAFGAGCPGLSPLALFQLRAVGLDQYVGDFEPASSEPASGDWTKYTFDTEGGDGPICIDGSPLTVFHQARDPQKLVIFMNGGGACWQDFYFCTMQADSDPPAESGIFADSFDDGGAGIDNPLADWSKLYVSYCDGSVFSGNNDVIDPNFPLGPVRYHRGVRNLTAAMDLGRSLHPQAQEVLLSGSSAGGFSVANLAPSIYRLVFPVAAKVSAFDDAGPPINNPLLVGDVLARANDWGFEQFYPQSCTDCDIFGDGSEYLQWTLDNDNGLRESLYSTDGDEVIRFFLGVPTQELYRDALLGVTDPINSDHPDTYKRFIRSGDTSHTSLRGDLFYTAEADGVPLHQWTEDFVNSDPGWIDIVEDFVPAP